MEGNEVRSFGERVLLQLEKVFTPAYVQSTPYEGASPLALAVWRNQIEKVRKLLRDGADVNKRGPDVGKGSYGDPPIHLAIGQV